MNHTTAQELLASYALDALDTDEVLAVDTHLATCQTCAGTVALLRSTAGELGSITPQAPPPALRERTIDAALDARRALLPHPAPPSEVHRIEAERLTSLVGSLDDPSWVVSVGDAFPDWTVHDLVAHLAATETLLAVTLGRPDPTPDTQTQPEPRAYEAVARHRRLEPAVAVAEFADAARAIDLATGAVPRPGAAPADPPAVITWSGLELDLDVVLTQRAFETWTHADDIRSALGLDPVPPPASSLATMSRTVLDGLSLMLLVAGADQAGRTARIELTGPGGGTYTVAVVADGTVMAHQGEPDLHLSVDVVDFCRAIGDRVPPDGLAYRATGDADLAADIVRSLPVLAQL